MRDRETIAAVSLSIAVLAFNFILGARLPIVWIDEVMYTDPAVNLALGRGLVSTAWYAQPSTDFWAGYPPLYAFLLAGWLKVFGVGCVSARSMNFVLLAGVGLMLWWAVRQQDLITTPLYRLAFLSLISLGMGMSWAFRTGRPDMLAAGLTVLVFLVASRPAGRKQGAALVVLGALLPFCQLQLGLYAAVTSGLLTAVWRAKYIRTIFLLGIGVALGLFALLGMYHQLGVLEGFWKSIIVHTSASGAHTGFSLMAGLSAIVLDLAVIPLSAVAAIVGFRVARDGSEYRREWIFGVLLLLLLPFTFRTVGKYHIAYSWMVWIPLSFLTCRWVSLGLAPSGVKHKLCTILLFVAMAGFPLRSVAAVREWRTRDYRRIEVFVNENVRPDDVIFSDDYAYYAVMKKAKRGFFAGHRPDPNEAAVVTAYLLQEHLRPAFERVLGGQWERVASFSGMSNSIPTLTLYRRKN